MTRLNVALTFSSKLNGHVCLNCCHVVANLFVRQCLDKRLVNWVYGGNGKDEVKTLKCGEHLQGEENAWLQMKSTTEGRDYLETIRE